MTTIFTRIIQGEIPGRFVWKDEHAVAFLSIHPLRPGHTLVVPRLEVEHWLDVEPSLLHHLMSVAHRIGSAIQEVYQPEKVGLMLAGLEVPHVHIHLVPIWSSQDLDFRNANTAATSEELDQAASLLRHALGAHTTL